MSSALNSPSDKIQPIRLMRCQPAKEPLFSLCENSGSCRLSKNYAAMQSNRAAGEREGAKAPLVIRLIAIKNVRYGLFDERSEIFRENLFSQKMWR